MSETNRAAIASNVRRIAHLDIPGGGQVEVRDGLAIVGHIAPPHGTTLVDVSDPRNPRVLARIDLEGSQTRLSNCWAR